MDGFVLVPDSGFARRRTAYHRESGPRVKSATGHSARNRDPVRSEGVEVWDANLAAQYERSSEFRRQLR